jgi:hypothetical protein
MRYTARDRAERAAWLREHGWTVVESRTTRSGPRTVWRSPDHWDAVRYTLGVATQRELARQAAGQTAPTLPELLRTADGDLTELLRTLAV